MKILNAIYAQSVGGVECMFYNYTKALQNSGFEVSLLISHHDCRDYEGLMVKKIFKLKNYSQISDFLHFLWIVWTYKPDVIFCHNARISSWVRVLRFLSKSKTIAINHGVGFKKSLYCDYIINVNKQIAQMVENAGFKAEKNFIIDNALNIDEEYFCKKINNLIKIGLFGRVEQCKGFEILLNAAKILKNKGYNFKLKIGGYEAHKNYGFENLKQIAIKNNIYENCEFVGLVEDKKSFFEDVDICCVPSRQESFGLVIIEGFLYSTIVISSDTDGGKLLIDHQKNGLLFKNGDIEDLVQKILYIKENPEKYCDFTRNAYNKLLEQYSLDALSKNLNKVFAIIFKKNHVS